jgi:glycerol-3-phosphate acyltransferase PlsX
MRIVLDAMGSDDYPDPEIQGAFNAVETYGDEIILVGPEDILKSKLAELPSKGKGMHILHAAERITMEDKGLALALKAKRKGSRTSMAVGVDLLQQGDADVFLTAGNTGGVVATAYYRLGMIPGVERPAVTGLFPVKDGVCAVLDIGANPDVRPEHLLQFAIMGTVYASKMRGIPNPRIGLLSNGEEPGKGNELIKHAFPMLESSGLHFIGNVEGKEIYGGEVDVVVTDGFSGNIFLKTSEAVAKLLVDTLRQELTSTFRTKIGALLAKPAFAELRRMLDPSEIGAAPLLGVNGLVFKAHGRSDGHAILNGIRTARVAVEANLLQDMTAAIQESLQKAKVLETA